MKLQIVAIGKMKSGPEQELFERYFKRTRSMGLNLGFSDISVSEFSESRVSEINERKKSEAEQILNRCGQSVVVALDEHGKDYSSVDFSRLLGGFRDEGIQQISFALGGPDGHGDKVLSYAKTKLRFGAMTWPHQIARILLIEQMYRAMTILARHPYHRQ